MFKKILGPEKYAEYERTQAYIKARKKEASLMDNEHFADELEYCMVNSACLLRTVDLVTSDDALVLVHLPEVLKRLRGRYEVPNTYWELRNRLEKLAGK